ncbi:hypothetical protein [Streptomyces sp. NBC_01565]|uniref:hypothetical protein n=1 Tax=Streptomyces sp. NBC_01565 TaxID=2975881 RepID=UPI0022523A69|nr:hypothetical protein [Streptomyces sp. NBC_01565]MCX4540512.1 hypothetical protein [Streptomyces sp. NBC_01565]
MPKPPQCPHCPEHPMLWKDTSLTSEAHPFEWRWYCTGCKSRWVPTSEQKMRYL